MQLFKPTKTKFAFLLPWLLYLLLELVTGGKIFTTAGILPLALLWIAGWLTELAAQKLAHIRSARLKLVFIAVGLALADQFIKLLVINVLKDKTITLIPRAFYVQEVLNLQAAWIPNRLGWDVPLLILSAAAVIILLAAYGTHNYYTGVHQRRNIYVDMALVLVIAGALSALVDQNLRGFTVDYITFYGYFTADLKDFYLTLGWAAVIAEALHSPVIEPPLKEFPALLARIFRYNLGK